jgi:predicted alpha/beta hydrolase
VTAAQPSTLTCADGYPLAADWFAAESPRAAVVVAPALGVPRRFYTAFAQYLAARGFDTLVFDYRGIGDSAHGPLRGAQMRMADWGRYDIDAALAACGTRQTGLKRFLVGHSAGGQLPGLAPNSEQLSGLVCVAASAPRLDFYPLRDRLGPAFLWRLAIPLLGRSRDQFPSRRIGFSSVDVPAGVMRQWARWALSSDYLFAPEHGMDTTRYARLALPLLSYGFLDDGYAPPVAIDALLRHYRAAHVEKREIPKPIKGTLGHFGYFRERQRDTLWAETADWLTRLC